MRYALLATALVIGCAPAAQHPQVPAQGAAEPTPAPGRRPAATGARPSGVPDARESIALEPVPLAPLVRASFTIAEPRQGALVVPAEASAHAVSVRGSQGALWIGLDEHAFRRVAGASTRLGALLLEDEELAPGPHRVVALQETDAGWTYAASTFFVGDEAGAPPAVATPSGVVLFEPRGTYNGDAAADGVTVIAWSLDPRATLVVRLSGPLLAGERKAQGEALRAVGLPSGDFRIETSEVLVGSDGRAVPLAGQWSTMARVITVNRDAPVPAPTAAKGQAR